MKNSHIILIILLLLVLWYMRSSSGYGYMPRSAWGTFLRALSRPASSDLRALAVPERSLVARAVPERSFV